MRSGGSSTPSPTTRMPTAAARVPEEIWPGYADSWASKKRATLGSALVLTSPGIPMLFQGQELIEGSWFADDDPLDWSLRHRHKGLLALHRDLVRLRRNVDDTTRGLQGPHVKVHHVDVDARILAFHRWEAGGPRDDVIVLASFSSRCPGLVSGRGATGGEVAGALQLGLGRLRRRLRDGPRPGRRSTDEARDGMPHSIVVGVGPYSVIILSQDD